MRLQASIDDDNHIGPLGQSGSEHVSRNARLGGVIAQVVHAWQVDDLEPKSVQVAATRCEWLSSCLESSRFWRELRRAR